MKTADGLITTEVRNDDPSGSAALLGFLDIQPGQSAVEVDGATLELRIVRTIGGDKSFALRSPGLPLETLRRIPGFRETR